MSIHRLKIFAIICAFVSFFLLGSPCVLALDEFSDGVVADNVSGKTRELVIDQSVSLPFEPARAFLLIERDSNEVNHFLATFFVQENNVSNETGEIHLQVGAVLPWKMNEFKANEVSYSFFFIGDNLKFAATEVRAWARAQIESNSISLEQMRVSRDKLDSALKFTEPQMTQIDSELQEIRERASKVAGIDEIIDLKMKLASLKGFVKDGQLEKLRLQNLVELGRRMEDPAENYVILRELSLQLKEAARATAMADRLNSRRRTAARVSVNKKLALVNRMAEADMKALTKDVFQLRAKRRKLEKRMNKVSDSEGRDF